jgi:integrase
MTVFKNRGREGRWSYNFTLGGERFQGYCVDPETNSQAKTRSQAIEIEATLRRTARQHHGSARSGIRTGSFTLAQALLLHINDQPGSTALHVANLKLYAREILAFFDPATPVVSIDAARIQDYQKFAAKQTNKAWRGGALKNRSRTDAKWWKDTGKVRSIASTNHYLGCLRGALQAAHKARDPLTGHPMLPFPPAVASLPKGKRRPRPMPDGELDARLEVAPPWTRDAAELARLFGLRRAEALGLERRHIDRERKCLRWPEDETKSGRDEDAHGGVEGWALLVRLDGQANVRDQDYLVTWPGPQYLHDALGGRKVPNNVWRPLKSLKRSWKTTAKSAEIKQPHRFHDVRARYITEVAKSSSAAIAQAAARHADPTTTAGYVDIAAGEVSDAVAKAVATRKRSRPHRWAARR